MVTNNTAGAPRPARLIAGLRKRWYVVALAAVIGGIGTFALSTLVTPLYHSNASLYFSLRAGDSGSDINQGSTYTQNQMVSFAQLAMSAVVLDRVVDDLGGDLTETAIRRSVTITTPQETVVLDVGVDTSSRELSSRIANSVSKNLTDVVAEMAPADSAGKPTVAAYAIQPAVPAKFQSSPNKQKNALLGGVAGGALSVVGLFVITLFDTRVRSVSVLRSMTDLPILGIAERTRSSSDRRPVALRSPNGSATERYRQIRAGLRFAAASDGTRIFAITSSIPDEGKTLTSLNLALILAESRERVLLIDADLRRPRVANYLDFEGSIGLTTVLVGGIAIYDAIHRFGDTTLDVLIAGDVPPNPAELLASIPMRRLIDHARQHYDFVIIDTAPLLSVADAVVIAQQCDATVVVADSSSLHQAQLEQTLDALDSAGAHVAGLILNRVKQSDQDDNYYRERHSEPASPKPGAWDRVRVTRVASARRAQASGLK